MVSISTRVEGRRGCGYRKGGGLYLVCVGIPRACGRLPIPCDRCPTCGHGIKPTRSWTWMDADALFLAFPCKTPEQPEAEVHCPTCPLGRPIGKAGLLWIGEKFYPTPEDWTRESVAMGPSRRIPAVPKGFEVGKTWVLVGHRKAIERPCPCATRKQDEIGMDFEEANPECEQCEGFGKVTLPGIFHMFQPTAVEYVVKGDETEEELERMEKRGLTLIRVVRKEDKTEALPLEDESEDDRAVT